MHRDFVLHLSTKLPEAHVTQRSREMSVCHHPFHVEVLDDDDTVLLRQLRGQLVYIVISDVRDVYIQTGQLLLCLFLVIRPLLFATECTG